MGNFVIFVGSSWNLVSSYIRNVDTHPESFSWIKLVIKKLSPKSLRQTYMKWTVGWCGFCSSIRHLSQMASHISSTVVTYWYFVSDCVVHNKRWHTQWQFDMEIRINKKVIAKKYLTNFYEMNSGFMTFLSKSKSKQSF